MNPFFALVLTTILVISNSEVNPHSILLLREIHNMPQCVLPLVSNKHPKVGIQFDNILLSYAVQGFNESNAHLITLNFNGQGLHYLTADNNINAYY